MNSNRIRLSNQIIVIVAIIGLAFSCNKSNLPPNALLKAFPQAGDTTILFDFSAAGSSDDHEYEIGLTYRWDFEGDGIWDTDYYHVNSIAHRFRESGLYGVTVEVRDLNGLTSVASDTIEVYRMNMDVDTLVDPRDGSHYKIVKIHGQWWMGENLRYGIAIPTDREQTDNDTVEIYMPSNPDDPKFNGGIYGWLEAMNYQVNLPKGICPVGWHLPSESEWLSLFAPYSKLYSLEYYRRNGHSNLNLDNNSFAVRSLDGSFLWMVAVNPGGFWSSTYKWSHDVNNYNTLICQFRSSLLDVHCGYSYHSVVPPRIYFSVRCIKD